MFTKSDPELAGNNKQTGEAFLAENAGKEGVITTASGLQYMILTAGEGEKPTATANVTVHYQGTTLDGKEFDSSYSRNAPATFPLNRVIAGWTEGVQLMPIGAKYRFFIHPDLGYGAKGAGAAIGPNETLVFEVELLSIQ
ncbi:FKBP-type peptidyl-prolyl cis-trans isomerase [Methyloprofundus sp.]|uniref:FKBP-type peptidyl-prolyl cis-trans isomerase n=1 Tax=Methyloprofundus sp. TaxID=2020875 RepID=UPI003D0BFE0E